MAKHKKPFIEACAYCRIEGKLTLDHVIPECIFRDKAAKPRRPLPDDIPIVYACAKCNNDKKSLDDSFLRDLLAMDADSFHNPVGREVFQAVRRAGIQGKSPLVRQVLHNDGRNVPMYTPGGIYIGQGFGINVDMERLRRVLSTIVKGLHLCYTDAPLMDGVEFAIDRPRDTQKVREVAETLMNSGAKHRQVADGSVFECIFAVAADRPDASLWLLHFYQGVVLSVVTRLPDDALGQIALDITLDSELAT